MADSIVRLTVEDSSFNAKIKAAAKAFADFGKNVTNAGVDAFQKFASGAQTAKVAFQGFNTVLKANALVFVATLAVQVGSAIGEMIGDWISGADDAESAQRKLNEELDRTAQIVKGILAESDFNARIAKAAGKSTSEILQMKYQDADDAYNKAMAAYFNSNIKVGTEEYNKAKKTFEEAEKARTKAWQDIQVDNTAREYKTGEYAPKGGRTTMQTQKNLPEHTELQRNQEKINTLTQEYVKISDNVNDATHKRQEEIQNEIHLLEQRNNILKLYAEQAQGKLQGGDVQTEGLAGPEFKGFANYEGIGKGLSDDTIEKVKEGMLKQEEIQAKLYEQMDKLSGNIGRFAGGLGSISSGLKSFGLEVPKEIDQFIGVVSGISQVIRGVGVIIEMFSTTSQTANTIALNANTAMMGGLITALEINSVTNAIPFFAHGGIVRAAGGTVVPGNYGYDAVPALLTSGELVLNKAQQRSLSDELQGNGMQNLRLRTEVSGRNLIVVIENDLKATGKGQLVTFK